MTTESFTTDFPQTIAEVLAPEPRRRGARDVAATDPRREEDPAAARAQAIVELVVLIAHQLLVEEPDAFEHVAAIRRERRGIDEAFLRRLAKGDRADAEPRGDGRGRGGREGIGSDGFHGSADRIGLRAIEGPQVLADEVGGDR